MAKVGIGEAFIGNIGMGKGGKVAVLRKEWWDLTEHAIREGKRTGVNIGIFNSPGWSQSGGPWIKSTQGSRIKMTGEWRTGKEDTEIYFITNQSDSLIKINPVFRTAGKQPELWDAVTGKNRILPQYSVDGNTTRVPLQMQPAQSFCIVFRHPSVPSSGINFPEALLIKKFNTPWQVTFDPSSRGPEKPVIFNTLTDWSQNIDERIRYYSGTAVITGNNDIEIEVVNLWVNRLIGDSKLPVNERKTWLATNPFKPGNKLERSGLIGDVEIMTIDYQKK